MSALDIGALSEWGFPTRVTRLNPDATDVLPLYAVALDDDHAVFKIVRGALVGDDVVLGSAALYAVMTYAKMAPPWMPGDIDIWVAKHDELDIVDHILGHLATGRTAQLGTHGSTALFSSFLGPDIQEVYDDWTQSIAAFDISVTQVGLMHGRLVFCEGALGDIQMRRMRVHPMFLDKGVGPGETASRRYPDAFRGMKVLRPSVTEAAFDRMCERVVKYHERGFSPVADDSKYAVNRLSSLFLYYGEMRIGVKTAAAPGVLSNADYYWNHIAPADEHPVPLATARRVLRDMAAKAREPDVVAGRKRPRVDDAPDEE